MLATPYAKPRIHLWSFQVMQLLLLFIYLETWYQNIFCKTCVKRQDLKSKETKNKEKPSGGIQNFTMLICYCAT